MSDTTAVPFGFPGDVRYHSPEIPPPCLGEHTQEVLAELGLSESEIKSLHAQKVI